MTSPIKVANKIDDFAIEISIADISSLTKGLLQLQHARYPHLVPMYRTIHRTKPRAMVLRAIRWVNPKRMFPGAGLTRDEMQNMSSDELEKLIVNLNDYRGEAHVIHNRYNQMIDLINMGELPYFIPYAGFKQDKWSMLQEYMDRAERLKDGTEEWENVLDRQALEIRNILLKREGGDRRKLDDIEGLWVDAKGQPAAPNFMDIKKGKEKKIALRKNRLMSNGKRVRHAPKVFVRRFAAVNPQEARMGEVIRMPAMGKIKRPGRDRPAARRIFDKHGGAAGHLVRMPKAWSLQTNSTELREKGNMISMPAGRKNPMILTFSELDFNAVANRREARWTQPDPLGKRGVARHRGAASGLGGHEAEGVDDRRELQRRRADNIRERQQLLDERRRRRRGAGRGPGRREATADRSGKMEQAVKINKEFNDAAATLLDKYDVNQTHLNEMQNIKAEDVVSVKKMGGGINADDGTVLVLKLRNGDKYVYKIVPNEQKSEQVADVIDKIFGLGVNVDTIQFNNIDADALNRLGAPTSRERLQNALDFGGGHLQAFCAPNCMDANRAHDQRAADLYGSDAYRGDLHRMFISDWLSGNWDRHQKNWMVSEDNRAVQIDTGFGFDFAQIHDDQFDNISKRGTMFSTHQGGATNRAQHSNKLNLIPGGQSALKQELEAVFDHHVSVEKIDGIQQAFGMRNSLEGQSIEEYKKDFMQKAGRIWGVDLGEPSPIGEVQFDNMENLFGDDPQGGGRQAAAEPAGTTTRNAQENREVAQEAGVSERRGVERRRQEREPTPAGVGSDVPRGVSGFTDSPGMRAEESSNRGMEDEDFDISEDEDREINTSSIDRALESDGSRDEESRNAWVKRLRPSAPSMEGDR